jgi:hypothetical protein
MGTMKVNHNVIRPWTNQSIAAGSGSHTTDWMDVNGWTSKVFTYEADSSGSVSLTITADISPQGVYELNNKTATTDDYATITLASAVTGVVAARVDGDDLDDLERPIRSMRLKGVNADASDATLVTAYIEGWS